MEKLNTLRDLTKIIRTTDRKLSIEPFNIKEGKLQNGNNFISIGALLEYKDVKEAAIKWIKNFYEPNNNTMDIKNWLEFFNIKEDDLK